MGWVVFPEHLRGAQARAVDGFGWARYDDRWRPIARGVAPTWTEALALAREGGEDRP